MWGIDIMSPMPRMTANGHQYIIVAIDYFTKWVETSSLSTIIMKNIVRFISKNIICQYGAPNKITIDNATNFVGKDLQVLCQKFKIQ